MKSELFCNHIARVVAASNNSALDLKLPCVLFCKYFNTILLFFKVDVIKTVTIPLMKRFLLDDEGLDLKVGNIPGRFPASI